MTDQEARDERETLIERIASAIHLEDNGSTPDVGYVQHDEYDATYRMPARVALDVVTAAGYRKHPEPHFEYKYGTRERRLVYPAGEWQKY